MKAKFQDAFQLPCLTFLFRLFHLPCLTFLFRLFHLPCLTFLFRLFHLPCLTFQFRLFHLPCLTFLFRLFHLPCLTFMFRLFLSPDGAANPQLYAQVPTPVPHHPHRQLHEAGLRAADHGGVPGNPVHRRDRLPERAGGGGR